MLKLSLNQHSSPHIITEYSDDQISTKTQSFSQSFIISAKGTIDNWPVKNSTELTADTIAQLIVNRPEVILIGCGARHQQLDSTLTQALTAAGIGFECMSTKAACRTYNTLVADDRRVVAGLIIEEQD